MSNYDKTRSVEKYTPEEVRNLDKHNSLSIGDLMDYIEKNGLNRDYKIVYERIEDSYFTHKGGWHTVDIDDDLYPEMKSEYIPALNCSIRNDDERGILFIGSHY